MPIVDMTEHKCAWCGDTQSFLCDGCFMYTCRDCLLGIREDGCVHKHKAPVTSQTWDALPNQPAPPWQQ